LEVLRRENELLKQTISEANSSIGGLEASLDAVNIPVPGSMGSMTAMRSTGELKPEDYWSPSIEVPDGYEYVDEYGPISNIPGHDGTECFKWDDTLWAKADHFKVTTRTVLAPYLTLPLRLSTGLVPSVYEYLVLDLGLVPYGPIHMIQWLKRLLPHHKHDSTLLSYPTCP
jgi:hypothetical protein